MNTNFIMILKSNFSYSYEEKERATQYKDSFTSTWYLTNVAKLRIGGVVVRIELFNEKADKILGFLKPLGRKHQWLTLPSHTALDLSIV